MKYCLLLKDHNEALDASRSFSLISVLCSVMFQDNSAQVKPGELCSVKHTECDKTQNYLRSLEKFPESWKTEQMIFKNAFSQPLSTTQRLSSKKTAYIILLCNIKGLAHNLHFTVQTCAGKKYHFPQDHIPYIR